MTEQKRIIFITGASGYVGEMLCDQFAKRADVGQIIALDKLPQSEYSKQIPKLVYLELNLADDSWQEKVAAYQPDTIIHTAWQIRAWYGKAKEQWQENVGAAEAVFDFAFANNFVKKLIHFSTAASYSARVENTLEHYFSEAEGLRDDAYIYALEKKVTEEKLREKYEAKKAKAKDEDETVPQVTIFRPAAITGPRGRFMQVRFGLQSALQGNLQPGFLNKVITTLTAVMPATKGWVRQFIHEDDVVDAVAKVVFEPTAWSFEAFNLTPTGAPVLPKAMGQAVGKQVLYLPPSVVRLALWGFWHGTRGRVPTCSGSWRFYAYPLLMSGEKLALIYQCRYSAEEAIAYTSGRYENFVPENKRRPLKNKPKAKNEKIEK